MSSSPPPPPPGPPAPERGRALYRVVYPLPARPRFVVAGGGLGRVLDCSESGIRYRLDEANRLPAPGDPVRGRVEFAASPHADVVGTVVRVAGRDVALRLAPPGLPMRTLFDQQRFVRTRFPFGDGTPPSSPPPPTPPAG